jgi:outer membrane protein
VQREFTTNAGVRAENRIGNRQILDVQNAQKELLDARTRLVVAQRNAYVADFNLLARIGADASILSVA